MHASTRRTASTLMSLFKGGVAGLTAALLLTLSVAANAQETTSSIRGRVVDASGAPVAGATVVVEDTRSGSTRTYTTTDTGTFLATRLLPGGPYEVTVNGERTVRVGTINLDETYNLTVDMSEEVVEEIVAVGTRSDFVDTAPGPSAAFTLDDLENAVAFSRDISDVYEIDPRLFVDFDEDGFGVNCVGKHPRFNNITLDGVSQADRFGLNENSYATAVGQPFPYDALEQVAVELAPFDATYAGFSACNINAVTKSGTNDWEFKAFYEYSSDSLRGDTVANNDGDFSTPSYDKTYRGFNVGGPIIRDRLFFFAAYADSEIPRFLARGFDGSGNGEERPWLSQSDYNRIVDIANNVYGYDPGGQPGDGTQEEEKYLIRLDWDINDEHRASLIYNYYDGFQLRDSDGDFDEFEFANHFYTKGAEFETLTARLVSQWNDAFSTEIFYSTSDMNDSQVTVGPPDFADFQISIGRDTVYLGADDSRQANRLGTDSEFIRLTGQYLLGDHIITAGYDRETLDIFNIFVQHSNGGEYDFFDDSGDNDPACAALTAEGRLNDPNCELSGIDRYELGRPSRIYYGSGGGTNNPLDAAANFSNTLNALYIQDEMFFDSLDLTITAGLRYEWFESDDRPVFNQAFTDLNNGLRNDANLDGVDLLMPRVGFTWGIRDDLTLRGGIGLYGGGNPNVWVSNAWSNDGLTNAQFLFSNFDAANTVLPGSPDSLPLSRQGRPGYDVPQSLVDDVLGVSPADANDSFLVLIDPDYKQPSEWKLALGATWDVPWQGIQLDVDYLYSRGENPAYYVDVSQDVVGTTAAGSPIYDYVRGEDNFMLTNSDENPVGHALSFTAQKAFDFGLEVLFGYAYIEAEEVSPMTSAVAASNFSNTPLIDLNDPAAGPSRWVSPNRFTLRLDYSNTFFADAETRITLFGYHWEGQAQSYGMSSRDLEGDGFFGRHLLYVPTGPSDPNVIFGPDFDQQAFFDFVAAEGLSPGFTEPNEFNAGWSSRFDLRIAQDIPLPGDVRGRLYFKVYNLGNLLNDDWGEIKDAVFFTPVVVDADVDPNTGQFIFNEYETPSFERTIINRSLWEARLGLEIYFGG